MSDLIIVDKPVDDLAITWYDNDRTKLGELRIDGLHTKRERLVFEFSDGHTKVLSRRRWWPFLLHRRDK